MFCLRNRRKSLALSVLAILTSLECCWNFFLYNGRRLKGSPLPLQIPTFHKRNIFGTPTRLKLLTDMGYWDPEQEPSELQRFIGHINNHYKDVLCLLAQKHSSLIYSLDSIQEIQVSSVSDKQMLIEVVFCDVDGNCVAVEVPVSFPNGKCSDLESKVEAVHLILGSISSSRTDVKFEISVEKNGYREQMSSELRKETQCLMSLINRDFEQDLILIAQKFTNQTLEVSHAKMKQLNPNGFQLLATTREVNVMHMTEEEKCTSLFIPFKKKCESILDFQVQISGVCEEEECQL